MAVFAVFTEAAGLWNHQLGRAQAAEPTLPAGLARNPTGQRAYHPKLVQTPETALKPGTGGRAAGLVSGTHKHRAETGETYVVVLITQRQQKVR